MGSIRRGGAAPRAIATPNEDPASLGGSRRGRRGPRAHALPRLGVDAGWASGGLAAEPSGHCSGNAHVPFRDVDGVGSGADVLLQRRLPPHSRHQAGLGHRQPVRSRMGGDLARYRTAHRARAVDRRGHLGRSAAVVSRAVGVRRRDLSYVLVVESDETVRMFAVGAV